MSANFDGAIHSLGLALPAAPKPAGAYVPVVFHEKMALLSGQVSRDGAGNVFTGKVGAGLSLEKGQEAARIAALNVISVIKNLIGWERFDSLLRVTGFVQVSPDFYDISQVVNGASELFLQVFGDRGKHARSAVGMASLPLNAAVELEVTLKIK